MGAGEDPLVEPPRSMTGAPLRIRSRAVRVFLPGIQPHLPGRPGGRRRTGEPPPLVDGPIVRRSAGRPVQRLSGLAGRTAIGSVPRRPRTGRTARRRRSRGVEDPLSPTFTGARPVPPPDGEAAPPQGPSRAASLGSSRAATPGRAAERPGALRESGPGGDRGSRRRRARSPAAPPEATGARSSSSIRCSRRRPRDIVRGPFRGGTPNPTGRPAGGVHPPLPGGRRSNSRGSGSRPRPRREGRACTARRGSRRLAASSCRLDEP